mgnify:CR=1 FL=1
MAPRALASWLLLFCCVFLPGEAWQGSIVIEEYERRPLAEVEEARALELYLADLELRLERAQAAFAEASEAPQRRLIGQDIATFTAELRLARDRRGGEVLLSRRRYLVRAATPASARFRMIDELEPLRELRVDRLAGVAELVGFDGRERIPLAPLPERLPVPTQAADAVLGIDGKALEMTIADEPFAIVVAPGIPNVFALSATRAALADAFAQALASLPGLPLRCQGRRNGRAYRLQVVALKERPVTSAELAPPVDDAIHSDLESP